MENVLPAPVFGSWGDGERGIRDIQCEEGTPQMDQMPSSSTASVRDEAGPCTNLAVAEDCAVESNQHIINHISNAVVIHGFLRGVLQVAIVLE